MKKYLLFVMLMCFTRMASACDVCGCSLGGNNFGLLPAYNKNFVGLRWTQARFHAYMDHNSQYFDNEYSDDTYSKFELWGKWRISNRVQFFAFVPYSYNDMNGSEQKVNVNGLSDITLMATVKIFQTTENEKKSWSHMMTVGAGLKLPTGKFDHEDQGVILNRNFQLGTGSVDFPVNAVYTIRYRNAGLNVEGNYKFNTNNSQNYRFGDQKSLSTQFFYRQNAGLFTLLPNAGFYFERAAKHHDGQLEITNTGGKATFLSAGLETYFSGFSLGVNYKRPLSQHYNSDDIADITSEDRWTLNVTYSF